MAGKGDAIRLEHLAMDQVVDRFANKNAIIEPWSEQLVPIRRRAIAGSDMIGLGRIVESLRGPADGIAPARIRIIGQDLPSGLNRQVRIAGQVMFGKEIVPQPGWIIIPEPISPIVAMPPKLRLTRYRFETALVRLAPKVVPAEVHSGRAGRSGAGQPVCWFDGAAAVAGCAI